MKPGKNEMEDSTVELDAMDRHAIEQKKKKRFALIGALSILVIIVGSTVLFSTGTVDSVRNTLSNETNKVGANSVNGNYSDKDGKTSNNNQDNAQILNPTSLPIDVPPWGESEYINHGDKKALRGEIYNQYVSTDLVISAAPLSSEQNGYHMGGDMDNHQVTLTGEEVVAATGEYIERLINPTFGGWKESQFPEGNADSEFPIEKFYDMFSDTFFIMNENRPFGDYVPVFADWNSDNYGMNNLSHVYRWHGELKSLKSSISGENTGSAQVTVNANIKFTSWTNNGEKITKDAVLNLVLIQGQENDRPLVIDKAQLVFK